MPILLDFIPFPLLANSHQQTIFGAFSLWQKEPTSIRKIIELPDSDKIALEVTTPDGWKKNDPTVILVHGLCGSHRSPYLVRLAKKLQIGKIRAIRLNLRGCGSGKGLAQKNYHCGQSEDILFAIKQLHIESPESPIVVVGFSLGGNIVIKMAANLESEAKRYIAKIICINAPLDVRSSIELLSQPHNRMYEKYFLRLLKAQVNFREKSFPHLEKYHFPEKMTLYDFDEIYTAPNSGFTSAEDYYQKCSAIHTIDKICIPCDILVSEDDPIICSKSLNTKILPKNIRHFKTQKGGHLGYLGKNPFYWIDKTVIDWINEAIS